MRMNLLLAVVLAVGGAYLSSKCEAAVPDLGIGDCVMPGPLVKAGVGDDTPSLIQAAKNHKRAIVRALAAELLGKRKDALARKALLEVLGKDPDRSVRQSAALSLAQLGEQSGIAALRGFMQTSSDLSDQVYLAGRLAEFGDPSGYKYVTSAARSKDARLRWWVPEALVHFMGSRDLAGDGDGPAKIFLSLAGDQSPTVRASFLADLPRAMERPYGVPVKTAREVAQRMAKDSDADVRREATNLLEAWRLVDKLEKEKNDESRKPHG